VFDMIFCFLKMQAR